MDELIETYQKYDILVGHEIIVMPKGQTCCSEMIFVELLFCDWMLIFEGRNDPERREAKALKFTKEGALQVQFKDDGSIKTLISEEVSVRPFTNSL